MYGRFLENITKLTAYALQTTVRLQAIKVLDSVLKHSAPILELLPQFTHA